MHFSIGPSIYTYKIPPGVVTVATSATGTPPTVGFLKLAYGAGLYVATATGSQFCYTSPDGVTWTARTMPGGAIGYWSDIIYTGSQFVAVTAGTVNSATIIATSGDGITWTQRNTPYVWANIAYGNSTYSVSNITNAATVNTGGTSPDAVTWTMRNMLNPNTQYNGLAFGNGVFVGTSSTLNGAATSNRAISSTDGFTWSSYTLPSSANWQGVDFANGMFHAYTTTTAAASSTNGTTWTARTVAAGSGPSAYGTNGWVMVKYNTANTTSVSFSTNGTTWTTVANALPAATWRDVIYGNGKFVFISSTGKSAALTFNVSA